MKKILRYLTGLISGMVTTIAVLYLLNLSGMISISSTRFFSVVGVLSWCYENLGLSLIPFFLIALAYAFYLVQLLKLLGLPEGNTNAIFAVEEKIDLLISLFFGVGVIWTAIGMRGALILSLGDMDAQTAAQKGAFYILTQLVEGGILLSLSTTILGGIGGYLMRIIKAWVVGSKLNALAEALEDKYNQEVIQRLDHIAYLLKKEN
ncbi:MAG: hypothetical protein V6Z89_20775 [Desulfobacter sp.]